MSSLDREQQGELGGLMLEMEGYFQAGKATCARYRGVRNYAMFQEWWIA